MDSTNGLMDEWTDGRNFYTFYILIYYICATQSGTTKYFQGSQSRNKSSIQFDANAGTHIEMKYMPSQYNAKLCEGNYTSQFH